MSAAAQATAPAGLINIDARFGDGMVLVGYLLSPRNLIQDAGSQLMVTLVWRCDKPPARGYRFFTHLSDTRGRLLANLDERGALRKLTPEQQPVVPVWQCPSGSYLLDPLTVAIPSSAPNKVQLQVGLFRGNERLTAIGGATNGKGAAVIKLSVRGSKPSSDRDGPVPKLIVKSLMGAAAPTIDGVLDDAMWQSAATTNAFVRANDGATAVEWPRGTVKVSYDNEHLYLAFEVQDDSLTGGFPSDAVDPQLWTRDTVEVMIDPDGDGDGRDYYEVQINPQNLVFDSHFDSYNKPRGGPNGPFGHQQWSAAARSAVRLKGTLDDASDKDEGYVVEAALPWSSFHRAKRAPPRPGDSWRMNFYAMQNNGGSAWSPLLGRGNFHRASRFGRIVFQ